MTMIESVLAGVERLLLPKLEKLEAKLTIQENELKSLRELIEVRFKGMDQRFDDLAQKFAFDQRLTALEERQERKSA